MVIRNVVCLIAILVSASVAPARADVVFDSRVVADFEFNIWSNGPLGNAGFPTDVFIPFQAIGDLTFSIDDAINDPLATTAAFLDVTGTLTGVSPGPFLPYDISPFEFVGGAITNIVRDGGGNIISADIEDLSMRWEMVGAPGGNPLRLYTRVGLAFNGQIDSIPFSVGTVFSGPAVFGGYLDTGMGASDPLAIFGRNRDLTVVPEPTAATVLFTVWGLIACRRRKRG